MKEGRQRLHSIRLRMINARMVLQVVEEGEANEPCTASCNLSVHRRERWVVQQMFVEELLRETCKKS